MSEEENGTPAERAQEMIKQVYEDKEMTINGRSYTFGTMVHKNRLPVFAYLSKITPMLQRNDMSFLGTDEWVRMEKTLCSSILFEDSQLSKLPGHWDKYPGDYLMFCTTALSVISYPFLAGNPTA